MIGWALRWVALGGGIALLCAGLLNHGAVLVADHAAEPKPAASPAPNTLVYTADQRGHVFVETAVNGAPVQMLVDTGASVVTLTTRDARAAGISTDELVFSGRASTANGLARLARVTLREVRIDQLSIYDVPAGVLENLDVSLLGMSFLGRLQSYEMRDGQLTITW
jgi:aspartyl protease family protein